MKILSRCVIVSKPVEDVKNIIKTSAYVLSKPKFVSNNFSIRVRRRYSTRGLFLFHVKGKITEDDGNTRVVFEVHEDITMIFSSLFIIAGVVSLLNNILNSIVGWFYPALMILIGIFVILDFIQKAKDVLEQLENKLQR